MEAQSRSGCLASFYVPNSYTTFRIIFLTYSDSTCNTPTAWFAVTSNVQKEIPIGTFISQQSSSSSCSVSLRGTMVTNSNGCVALSAPGGYAKISSCPTNFNLPTTTSPVSTTIYWAGNYKVNSVCSTSTCCCLTGTIEVAQTGLSIKIQGPVTGNCGTTTSFLGYATLSSSTSTTVTFNILGSSYSATRSGNQVIVTNLGASQCSGSATCISGACNSSSAIVIVPVSIVMLLFVMLVL